MPKPWSEGQKTEVHPQLFHSFSTGPKHVMSDWILAIEGTDAAPRAALMLALLAAVLHAVFGALQKGRHDPLLVRGAIDASYGFMAAPFAFFVVPWPEPHMWPIFGGVFVIHGLYKWATLLAYRRGAFTVVYPVMRGTGPLFTILGAWLLFGERFNPMQWVGVAVLLAGLYGLAIYNMARLTVARDTLMPALGFAVLTGLFVALYTTFDAFGIRATADPFTSSRGSSSSTGYCFPGSRCGSIASWLSLRLFRRWFCAACLVVSSLLQALARSCWQPASIKWARRQCCAKPRRFSRRSSAGCS